MAAKSTAEPALNPDDEAMLAKGKLIMERLEEVYPKAPEGFLDHNDPFTLLIAVLLSAQSLDTKVNEITPKLFEVGGTPEKMRELGETKIHDIIKKIGLAPQKAKNIAKLSKLIIEQFGGNVPDTFEGLESLPGVGHKTASVVMMQAFNKPAFPVDTHIHRLACRWGCGDAKSVEKTEAALKMWFPDPTTWGHLHTRIILFGREHCPARKHDMYLCPICSFAATDEAKTSNKQSPNKFVAAKSHKNPFSVRDVPIVDPLDTLDTLDDDPSYMPVASSKPKSEEKRRQGREAGPFPSSVLSPKVVKAPKRATKRKSSMTINGNEDEGTGEEVEAAAAKRPRRSRKSSTGTVKSVVGEGGAGEEVEVEVVAKRPRRARKASSETVKTGVDDGDDGGAGDAGMQNGKIVKQAVRRGGRRKAKVSEALPEMNAKSDAPKRRSSRVRAREEGKEDSD